MLHLRARMAGTVILPLLASGAVLMGSSGAAPNSGMQPCYETSLTKSISTRKVKQLVYASPCISRLRMNRNARDLRKLFAHPLLEQCRDIVNRCNRQIGIHG